MSVRNLDALFEPHSVAVVGASERPQHVGTLVMRNLLRAGFAGRIVPVNPHRREVQGVAAVGDVADLTTPPDLAVIATPPAVVPGIIETLARRGTRAAVVLTAGLAGETGGNRRLGEAMLAAAARSGLRILGPNCLGLIVSRIRLDASFAHVPALPGHLAFVSQSGALCTAALDWAHGAGVGFSHFVSLGSSADVDAGDVLDYLGAASETRAILLYLEALTEARKFMSAARAAARNKPVIVVKAGRAPQGARAAASHSGALAGADDVYDAAFRRAGMLRVRRLDELFDAAETLARAGGLRGDRLAIVTNGGGLGVLATDALVAGGGRLAELAPETREALGAHLPPTASVLDPVDIIGDAPPERHVAALRCVLDDPGTDAVLLIHAPTAIASAEDAARAVGELVRETSSAHRVLTSWAGGTGLEPARHVLREAGLASYDTPEDAVAGFLQLVTFRRNQELLTEVPPSMPTDVVPHPELARAVVGDALADGREWLDAAEVAGVLGAYGIPLVETRIAADPAAVAEVARALGGPVAVKVLSPDVVHKSDVGGVALDLDAPADAERAARGMMARVRAQVPSARITGFVVQPMARRPQAVELVAGLTTDPLFGPVVVFGHGGTAVEVLGDHAVALPPLNALLARALVARTRVARLLAGYRDRPPANLDAVARVLIGLAQLAIDVPQVTELDLNPLLADEHGVLTLDARIRVSAAGRRAPLAIRPYPRELEEPFVLRNGRHVLLRPIRPEDEPAHHVLVDRLDPEDVRFRFFGMVRRMPHSQMARYTQIDYDREMAFVAVADAPGGGSETLGVVRAVTDPDGEEAEFAILIRSDLKGQGLGYAMLEKLIRYCRARGMREIVGQVLPDNVRMLELAQSLGFSRRAVHADGVVEVRLRLRDAPVA